MMTTVKRDLRWGTPTPIPLIDGKLGLPVSARAFGRWGARITEHKRFLTQIIEQKQGERQSKFRITLLEDYCKTLQRA